MNENILLGTMAEQANTLGFGAAVQQHWYAIFVVPILFVIVKMVRGKRRHKIYRW